MENCPECDGSLIELECKNFVVYETDKCPLSLSEKCLLDGLDCPSGCIFPDRCPLVKHDAIYIEKG